MAVEIRVRLPPAIAEALREGKKRNLSPARRQDTALANAKGETGSSNEITPERRRARAGRPQVIGKPIENSRRPRAKTPRLIGPHKPRIGKTDIGLRPLTVKGLSICPPYGPRTGVALGNGQEAPNGLPPLTALSFSGSRRSRVAIPRDTRRRSAYSTVRL